MGVSTNLSQSNVKLGFLMIKQQWLRTAVKFLPELPVLAALLREHMPYSRAVDRMLLQLPCDGETAGDGKVDHTPDCFSNILPISTAR